MERPIISEHEMVKETELFYQIFSVFIEELDLIERTRGKLNDFQLMQAVYRAKDNMGILGWERRQIVSAIFEKYMHIYRVFGRLEADEWVTITFGYSMKRRNDTEMGNEATNDSTAPAMTQEDGRSAEGAAPADTFDPAAANAEALSRLIAEKESELLQLYRALYLLQQNN